MPEITDFATGGNAFTTCLKRMLCSAFQPGFRSRNPRFARFEDEPAVSELMGSLHGIRHWRSKTRSEKTPSLKVLAQGVRGDQVRAQLLECSPINVFRPRSVLVQNLPFGAVWRRTSRNREGPTDAQFSVVLDLICRL